MQRAIVFCILVAEILRNSHCVGFLFHPPKNNHAFATYFHWGHLFQTTYNILVGTELAAASVPDLVHHTLTLLDLALQHAFQESPQGKPLQHCQV